MKLFNKQSGLFSLVFGCDFELELRAKKGGNMKKKRRRKLEHLKNSLFIYSRKFSFTNEKQDAHVSSKMTRIRSSQLFRVHTA